jgi:hypothetical protein
LGGVRVWNFENACCSWPLHNKYLRLFLSRRQSYGVIPPVSSRLPEL